MAQTPKTNFKPIGDIVVDEYSPIFCREEKTITNSSGAVMDLVPGHPMDDNVPEVAGNEAQVDGILMERVYLEDGQSAKAAVLVRGPCVINKDALPDDDYAGDALNKDDIETALLALSRNFLLREEPTLQLTQET